MWRGLGWRIGRDPDRQPFNTLVGADSWAFELTEAEWQDLCLGVERLQAELSQLRGQLMEAETITLEHVSDRIRLTLSGLPDSHILHLQTLTGRGTEGSWSASAVPALTAMLRQLGSGAIGSNP